MQSKLGESLVERLENRCLLSAVVAAITPVSTAPASSGVTIHEKRGVGFTTDLGMFVTPAPATNLQASIQWGDGTTSAGKLKADGVVGIDEVKLEVDGTHTYKKAGVFPVSVTVFRPGPTPTTVVVLIARFSDTAIVARGNTSLDGAISGKYSLAPTAAGIGAVYVFNGTGTAGDLGPVSASGNVRLPDPVATAADSATSATGTLTLESLSASAANSGSVTLKLTGPVENGPGPFPTTLDFTIVSGTGAFTGATGSGSIAVTLGANQTFTFSIRSILPVV